MSNPNGIVIFGANGSGKTTLGRELAHILNFVHIDHEAYCFEASDIPYTVKRPSNVYTKLMLKDIEKSCGFILSGVIGNFGEKIERLYSLAVYIEAPLQLRVERIKKRSIENFGKRVREGGDMYEQEKKFVEFVANRPQTRIDDWMRTLKCPIVRIDGTADYKKTAIDTARHYLANEGLRLQL